MPYLNTKKAFAAQKGSLLLKGVNQDPTLFQDLKVRVCQTKTVDPNDLVFKPHTL